MYLVLADRDGEGPAREGVALPTDAATVEAFWRTVRAGADLAGQRVELPVWMVRGEEVLARVGDGSVRVSEAVAPAVIEALRALQDPAAATVASVARDWHEILAARARVKPIKARLEPVQSDWWDVGWRAWEPIGPAPVGPPPMFDPLEAGKRLLASARPMPGDPLHWRWWRAPFGPAISREEAFAWLGVAIVSQRVSQAVEMLAHWDPGPVDEAEASHVAGSWRLPPAANLRALATIIGPERTIEWLYERLARDPRSYGPEQHYASGVRAGLLPLMSAAQLQTLSDRVRSDCQRVPWTHGRVSPHPSHLLAGPLGLHDVCEHTINHHRNLTGANGEYLLYHGLRSPHAALDLHRGRLHTAVWQIEAFLAIAGPTGAEHAMIWPEDLRSEFPRQADECLWPLLRKPWPELKPGMTALLGTSLDNHARAWLKRHAR
jgi:hypothetical protein